LDVEGFRWSKGVQALTILLLRHAAWGRRCERDQCAEPPALEGVRQTPAATLNDALSQIPAWMEEIFGQDPPLTHLHYLVSWKNRDFKTIQGGPVKIAVNPSKLRPTDIRVWKGGQLIEDPARLYELAEAIYRQRWTPEAAPDANLNSVSGVSEEKEVRVLTKYLGKCRVEIRIDADFDSYSDEEKASLLEELRKELRLPPDEIRVKGRRRGSVILKLELPAEAAGRLIALAQEGAFSQYRVTDAWPDDPACGAAAPETPKRPSPSPTTGIVAGVVNKDPFALEELAFLLHAIVLAWIRQAKVSLEHERKLFEAIFTLICDELVTRGRKRMPTNGTNDLLGLAYIATITVIARDPSLGFRIHGLSLPSGKLRSEPMPSIVIGQASIRWDPLAGLDALVKQALRLLRPEINRETYDLVRQLVHLGKHPRDIAEESRISIDSILESAHRVFTLMDEEYGELIDVWAWWSRIRHRWSN
jgi:hypothetical protein